MVQQTITEKIFSEHVGRMVKAERDCTDEYRYDYW